MRVWLAPSAFFPHLGGVEELTLQLARQLVKRGHDVLVVAPRHPPSLPADDRVEDLRVKRIGFTAPRRSVPSLLRYPFQLSSQLALLTRTWRRERPDLVHVQCPSVQLPAVALLCVITRTPLVITSQGETQMDAFDLYGQSAFMRAVLSWSARRAAALTACSRWTANAAAMIAPEFASARIILNGIDPAQWDVSALPDQPVVCAWGRHVPQKGLDLLIEAFAKVLIDVPEAELLIGGSGAETGRLEAMAGANVTFLGALDRDGVQGLLDRSRVAVVPSRLEPFGIVALEAMAAGRPVVWSVVGGLIEATQGSGWGVDPTDVDALAHAVVEALIAAPAPQAMRGIAEASSWSSICDQYLQVYSGCLAS